MSTLKSIFDKYNSSKGMDIVSFKNFLDELNIKLNGNEVDTIFNMLLLKDEVGIHYKEVRTFFKATRVYDESKYPPTPIQQKKKSSRKSYKIYPDQSATIQTEKTQSSNMQ